jgi:hypothetical protein
MGRHATRRELGWRPEIVNVLMIKLCGPARRVRRGRRYTSQQCRTMRLLSTRPGGGGVDRLIVRHYRASYRNRVLAHVHVRIARHAGVGANTSWTYSPPTGPVTFSDVSNLRTALNDAVTALLGQGASYSTTPTLHGVIHAADYQDIREAVK